VQRSRPTGSRSPRLCRPQAGDHRSRSHLRLRVLDSRALPVQEAVLGVDHLLGLAGLLESGLQLHRHVLAHCGKESTGGVTGSGHSGGQRGTGQQQRQVPGVGRARATASRKEMPQPFKEITGNGSADSAGEIPSSGNTQTKASVQAHPRSQLLRHSWGGRRHQCCLQLSRTAPLRSHRSLCAANRSLPTGRGRGLPAPPAPAWVTAPPRPPGNSSPGALGTQGLCWGPSSRRGAAGQDAATNCAAARGAATSSNTARALPPAESTAQHVFAFIKLKKKINKKETKALFLL